MAKSQIKSFLKSKVFWFNILSLIVMVANMLGFQDFIPSEKVNEIGVLVIALGNGILRFATKTPIKIR